MKLLVSDRKWFILDRFVSYFSVDDRLSLGPESRRQIKEVLCIQHFASDTSSLLSKQETCPP
jgi:hypothetical protein